MSMNQGIARGQRLEFVGSTHQRQARLLRQGGRHGIGKTGWRVQAGADGSAPQCQLAQMGQGGSNVALPLFQLGNPTGELLPQGERGGILQVGAANLDDVVEGVGLAGQRRAQGDQGGQQLQGNGSDGRQVHGAREDIIARLAEVDLIVGMDETALPPRTAEKFAGPVGQHLVDIHVGLGARACLPDAQWKLLLMQAAQHFIGGAHDGLGRAGGQ